MEQLYFQNVYYNGCIHRLYRTVVFIERRMHGTVVLIKCTKQLYS